MKKKITHKIILVLLLFCCNTLVAQEVLSNQPELSGGSVSEQRTEMGNYSQKSSSTTGSIATITGDELDKSPTSTLSLTMAGKLPGLMIFENSSELTNEDVYLQLRGRHTVNSTGEPLILIDGIVVTSDIYESISPSEIESITLLKDASTQAIFGILGANGVIIITTKKGIMGKMKIDVSLENSVQKVSTKPTFINSWEYATMRNEAAANDGIQQPFTEEQIANFKSGSDLEKYPNTNWYDLFMNDFVMQQRVNVGTTGGNDRIKYFTNINVVNQGNQFKCDNSDYDASDVSQRFNFRANVDIKIFNSLNAYFRSTGSIKREKTPANSTPSTIYESLFLMPSSTFGPLTPDGEVVATSTYNEPTYGLLNRSGFAQLTSSNTISQFGLDLDLASITKGLRANGFAAFETYGSGYLCASQTFERWIRTNDLDDFSFIKKGDEVNSSLGYSKTSSFQYQLIFSGNLSYHRTFGKNELDAMCMATYHDYSSPDYRTPYLYPYKRIISGAMVNYNYDNRYLLKVDCGYSGSDQFPNYNRFFVTPAISAGWIVSNEHFFKNKNFISYLKIRGSYGSTANDDFGDNRYSYLDEVTYTSGGPISSLKNVIEELGYGNPDVAPEVIKKQNIGIDLGISKTLTIHFDYFNERIDNMYIYAATAIPSFQGIPLDNYPYTNSGEMENKGFEFEMSYTKKINEKLTISVEGMMSVARNTLIYIGEVQLDEDYAYRYNSQGYPYGQQWGYLVDKSNGNGYFNSVDEITNSNLTYEFGTPRLGDLKYKDLNGDNIINIKDMAPIGNGTVPAIYYGLNAFVKYNDFDLSVTFQGIGNYEVVESGYGINETLLDGVYSEIHKNAWNESRYANNEKITFPALAVNTSTNNQVSNFYLNNTAYLRLKNIEIGYNVPSSCTKLSRIGKFRIFASGQNLITIQHKKFHDFGPEGSYTGIPVYKVYNVGLQINF